MVRRTVGTYWNQLEEGRNKRMTTQIEEFFGYHDGVYQLVMDICPCCDTKYVEERNCDPGSTEEAIGIIYTCPSCSEKASKGEIDLGCQTDWSYIEKIRKDNSLPEWSESHKKFKKESFDSYLKMQGNYPQWYASNLAKADEQDLKALSEMIFPPFWEGTEIQGVECEEDYPEHSEEEIATMLWVYGDAPKPGHDMSARDEVYKDLIHDRLRELGGSYW